MKQLLVFGERDDAEEVAETLGDWFPGLGVPRVVREALAGEDDAEDAQWVVVLEGAGEGGLAKVNLAKADLAKVDELVSRYEGWREEG
ncbi:hypothetical protein [Nonomuraea sp. SBT364]|uniref:hypothetical protein n=1 Tax=Nonomuraea sp. SBT364 TaxID=1580530 RepID=UPI00066BA59D|nr:hypothetical protein [Nonomuraea sp. SBT364]